MKISFKPKHECKIDLKQYGQNMMKSNHLRGKDLIVSVMNKLIEHTENAGLEMTGDEKRKNQFRLTQFKRAVASLRECQNEIHSGRQAKELPGIGKGIADRIDEIFKTGTLAELGNTSGDTHVHSEIMKELLMVTGIGESHAKKFADMGVTGISDLRSKVDQQLIKVTHHIQVGLKYYHDFLQKIPYDEMVDLGNILRRTVNQLYSDIIIEVCGSHRRQRPYSGDIDILMTHPHIITDDDLIQSQCHYLKNIVKQLKDTKFIVDDLTTQGDTKYMGVCVHPCNMIGRRIDIRFVTYDSFYPAILYFTGSMTLNKLMRNIAIDRGYTLNEYGIYKVVSGVKSERIMVNSEREIFDLLNIAYLEPKDREMIIC
jgi:DNA polymerase beta